MAQPRSGVGARYGRNRVKPESNLPADLIWLWPKSEQSIVQYYYYRATTKIGATQEI